MPACSVCEVHAESTFKIEGMDCREEVAMLERRFKNLIGLEGFSADLMGQRLHVKYDAAKLTASAIADAVAETGMRAWLEHEEPIAIGGEAVRRRRAFVVASGVTLSAGLLLGFLGRGGVVADALFVTAVACGLGAIWRRTVGALRARALDINVLMVIAVAGALVLRQFGEAASVIFLFAVAESLEALTLDRARMAIRALMDLAPVEAQVRDATGERRVPVDAVSIGAVIVVRPGEKIPLDGEVIAGQSEVNQAPITGESLPIEKGQGDGVFAGTINGRGALDIRVTRHRRDTTLARIVHLVERAQAQRAPAQSLVERFARVYTPAVIVLAVLVAVVPPIAFGGTWHDWTYRALVLLVVSCPCALVISTPVSVVAALAGAARKGVLIKGGAYLERTGRIRCVAFDKTGTLTRGAPQVVDVVSLNGVGVRSGRRPGRIGRAPIDAPHRPGYRGSRRSGPSRGAAGGERLIAGRARRRGRRGRREGRARQSSAFRRAAALLARGPPLPRPPGRRRTDRGPRRTRRPGHRHHRARGSCARGGPGHGRSAAAPGRRVGRDVDRRQPPYRRRDGIIAGRRRGPRGSAAGGQGHGGRRPAGGVSGRSRWLATASTTRRRSRPPTSAS